MLCQIPRLLMTVLLQRSCQSTRKTWRMKSWSTSLKLERFRPNLQERELLLKVRVLAKQRVQRYLRTPTLKILRLVAGKLQWMWLLNTLIFYQMCPTQISIWLEIKAWATLCRLCHPCSPQTKLKTILQRATLAMPHLPCQCKSSRKIQKLKTLLLHNKNTHIWNHKNWHWNRQQLEHCEMLEMSLWVWLRRQIRFLLCQTIHKRLTWVRSVVSMKPALRD